jgi:hypothetical protein
MLANGPISWKCGFQHLIALSTCEAELRAVNAAKEAIKQALWLTKLCHEAGLPLAEVSQGQIMPIRMHEDNKAMIDFSRNPIRHSTMKHLERDIYWIQECVANGGVKFIQTISADMWADIGTKPLVYAIFSYIRGNIMILTDAD